jgi:two-component system CheB/CheR fusion protein
MPDSSDTRFGLAIDQAQDLAVFWMNPEGCIEWWSSGAEKIFGYAQSEIVGEHVQRLFVPEDIERGLPRYELTVAGAIGVGEDDRWHLRADGSRFWSTGFVVATRNGQGELLGYAKVVRDRTDIKEQLEALRNKLALEQETGRRKDVFLATLSHELRNVLAPLATGLGIVRRSMQPGPEVELGMRIVGRQTDLMRSLVDDLLDLARISEGKIVLAKQRIALERVVENVTLSQRPIAEQRRQRLNVLSPEVPTLVDVDPDRMQQVVNNLIDNAIKFTPAGGTIYVKTNVEGNEAVLRVEDDGVGIAPNVQPLIFQLFTQAERGPAPGTSGLGIGLSLVKDIVTLHGGSVQVRSGGLGKGSEFTVRLPLATMQP